MQAERRAHRRTNLSSLNQDGSGPRCNEGTVTLQGEQQIMPQAVEPVKPGFLLFCVLRAGRGFSDVAL